ncbi:hypothetical protein [Sinomonas sp. ASV322]|uniref:hypothetical protein n=1 Tax=Sinomonas sp. ASV322 TaxID=3041920 RepID=UPI0027DD9C41|nr:hypothetical protein [Sinomonas sp. ASV322]MDQ4502171.1 hypothetical protein [Sinomonas sp. ASV322]
MHDRPRIRVLRVAGSPLKGIARDLGASRNAVRRALAPGARDSYWRASDAEAFEPAVRDVLADYPGMPVSDIAVMVDWRRSRRALSDLVARLRPEFRTAAPNLSARPAESIRTGTIKAGEASFGVLSLGEVAL